MCGKAEPVVRPPDSASCSPVLTARAATIESRVVTTGGVSITTSTSSPNFDQSSLGSDDSGICCSSGGRENKLRLTRSAEYLEDDDGMMQFDESKSLESDEMEFSPETSAASHPAAEEPSSTEGEATDDPSK